MEIISIWLEEKTAETEKGEVMQTAKGYSLGDPVKHCHCDGVVHPSCNPILKLLRTSTGLYEEKHPTKESLLANSAKEARW